MARMKHIVRSWGQADQTFRTFARVPRHGGARRVNMGYATWLHQRWPEGPDVGEPNYAVRFHATDVVTYHPDGSFTLATDGWFTKTTRERIEDFTPSQVHVRTKGVPRRRGASQETEFEVIVTRGEERSDSFDMTQMAEARFFPAL